LSTKLIIVTVTSLPCPFKMSLERMVTMCICNISGKSFRGSESALGNVNIFVEGNNLTDVFSVAHFRPIKLGGKLWRPVVLHVID
jgi:hypothetical protein